MCEAQLKLTKAIEWAKSKFNSNCYIVGGSVRDILLGLEPSDYDIFYPGVEIERLRSAFGGFKIPCANHPRFKDLAAELESPFGKAQIFTTDKLDANEKLLQTDWNVSNFAFDGIEIINRSAIDDVGDGKRLKLLTISSPVCTLKRGFEFSTRYNMELNIEDIKQLCAAILSEKYVKRRRRKRKKRKNW